MGRDERRTARRTGVLPFVLLCALLLPLLWQRTSPEATLWMDEIHSLQLTRLPVSRLLEESARDFHPPGYALALKAWIEAGRLLGLDPGVAWARSLNLLAWLLAVGVCWFAGGSALGRRGGALLALGVGASAAAGVVVRDLRSYAFAFAALTAAVVLLAALGRRGWRGRWRGRWQATLWTSYSLALTAALWSHLLAAPAVAVLGVTWMGWMGVEHGMARRRRGAFSGLLAGWRPGPGLVAHVVPWLLFLPWLVRIPGQVQRLRQASPDWMTPATGENLLRVFTWWIPLGRVGPPNPAAEAGLSLLGAVAVAVPVAAGLLAVATRRRRSAAQRCAALLAGLALPTALGSIILYWLLARLGHAATFHAPRYPLLVAGVLAAGLVGSALAAKVRPSRAGLLLLPWLVAALVGHALALRQEARPGGLAAFRPALEAMAPDRQLYVSPSELRPFVRRTFSGFELHPVEDLVCDPPDRAVVLGVNPWPDLDRTRDRLLRRAIHSGRLAASVEVTGWSDLQTRATAWQLHDLDAGLAERLCARGLGPPSAAPAQAVAVAHPLDQASHDGWSFVKLGDDLDARRWGRRPQVRIRFDRRVPAGEYRLHLLGVRHPHPSPVLAMELELEGGGLDAERTLGPGPFHLEVPVRLHTARRPVLRVHHPVWSPARATGSADRRWLTFLFEEAWLVPAERPAP